MVEGRGDRLGDPSFLEAASAFLDGLNTFGELKAEADLVSWTTYADRREEGRRNQGVLQNQEEGRQTREALTKRDVVVQIRNHRAEVLHSTHMQR